MLKSKRQSLSIKSIVRWFVETRSIRHGLGSWLTLGKVKTLDIRPNTNGLWLPTVNLLNATNVTVKGLLIGLVGKGNTQGIGKIGFSYVGSVISTTMVEICYSTANFIGKGDSWQTVTPKI